MKVKNNSNICNRCQGKGYITIKVIQCHFEEDECRPCPDCNSNNKNKITIPNQIGY